jgi:lipid A 3-O-deacylase
MNHSKSFCLFCLCFLASSLVQANTPEKLLLGYGVSIPGFGDTSETVHTADIGIRWEIDLSVLESGPEGPIEHEVWIEPVFHAIVHDSDRNDSNDYGFATLSFLGAWILSSDTVEPYFFLGGGPTYLFANIEGMGSDLNGNYQAGFGVRSLKIGKFESELQLKYFHVSNLNRAKPNVPLNSVRFAIGFRF